MKIYRGFLTLIFFFSGVFFSSFLTPAQANDSKQTANEALEYLNALRQAAGLEAFSFNKQLRDSAYNHAVYLYNTQSTSHFQSNKTSSSFTGYDVAERSLYVGYPHSAVGENISGGQQNFRDSIDGLMSAIYHRFGFLDPEFDEIGLAKIARQPNQHNNKFVYVMGNRGFTQACQGPEEEIAAGSYFTTMCRDSEKKIPVATRDFIQQQLLDAAPDVVMWPYNQAVVSPIFLEEDPDPLPLQSISGYPVSLWFHPQRFRNLRLISFELINSQTNTRVPNIHILDKDTDPNNKFTPQQFAFFPLYRLDWGANYLVNTSFESDTGIHYYAWQFATTSLDQPVVEVEQSDSHVYLQASKGAFIYLPQQQKGLSYTSLQSRIPQSLEAEVSLYDPNTLELQLTGQACEQLELTLDDYFRIYVSIAPPENYYRGLQEFPSLESLQNSKQHQLACKKYIENSLPGTTISTIGQKIAVRSGETRIFSFSPDLQIDMAAIEFSYPSNTGLHLKAISQYSLEISFTGTRGNKLKASQASKELFQLEIN